MKERFFWFSWNILIRFMEVLVFRRWFKFRVISVNCFRLIGRWTREFLNLKFVIVFEVVGGK